MNLRALSNFLSVAAAGSLQGAADVVHIAQPALTRQIAMLEEEFGTRLFLRHHRGVTLTEAGEQLREHAERILAEVAKTRVAMSTAAEQPTGTVSLGLPTAMRSVLSSTVVSAYHKAYPSVQLNVHEAFVHIIEDFLQMRQVDVGIVFDRAQKFDNFDVTPLVTEDIYLAGPRDAGLDQTRPVSIKELAKVPIILLSKRNQLYQAAKQAMAEFNCDFRPFLEVEGEPLTIDLVKKGVGYTIRPFCAVQTEVDAEEISVAPIRGLTITWALGVNRVRAHTPAVRELIAFIRQAVDDRIANGTWRTARGFLCKGYRAKHHRSADAALTAREAAAMRRVHRRQPNNTDKKQRQAIKRRGRTRTASRQSTMHMLASPQQSRSLSSFRAF